MTSTASHASDESRDSLLYVNGSFLPGDGDMSVSVSSLPGFRGLCQDTSVAPSTPPSSYDHDVTFETTCYLPGDSICSFAAFDDTHVIDNAYLMEQDEDARLFGKKRQRCAGDEVIFTESHKHKRIKKESPATTNSRIVPSKMSFLRRRMRKVRHVSKLARHIHRKFVNIKPDTTTCIEGETPFVIPNPSVSTYSSSDVTTDADESLTLFERQLSTMERCLVSNKVTFWRSEDLYPSDTE